MDPMDACMAYLKKLPPAISGSGGHNATLAAALACRRFGLSTSDTWRAMVWFNENHCQPRWSAKELRHKVDSVTAMSIVKPLRHAGGRPSHRSFVAPEAIGPANDQRPICQQSEQAEELFWARVAIARGMTLEEFDKQCGL